MEKKDRSNFAFWLNLIFAMFSLLGSPPNIIIHQWSFEQHGG
jgi:hypothetical protein